MNKVLLIDGNSLTYRAYYGSAFGLQGILTNSKGIPVNAVSILNRMISKAILKYNPTHVFVAFDAGKKTKRHDKLDSYKGGRQATPKELIVQFPIIKEMLDKMGIKRYEIPEIEADDIIGTLARKFAVSNNVYVLSSDKDLYQLVGKNITVISPQNGTKEDKIIEENEFFMRQGYNPCQVADMKGLVGDASDNLPGVKGVGEKGAIKLLEQYKTLECIFENINNHSDSLRAKLLESKEMAFLCKELAQLDCNVYVPFEIDDIEFTENSSAELIDFFKRYEINSLVRKYESLLKTQSKEGEKKNDSQMSFNNIFF